MFYVLGLLLVMGCKVIKVVNQCVFVDFVFLVKIDEVSRKWWVFVDGNFVIILYILIWIYIDEVSGKVVIEWLVS